MLKQICNIFLMILFIWFSHACAVYAQGNAYAKFDAKGSTIGLYNLLSDVNGCEESRRFSGLITKAVYKTGESSYTTTFTLNTGRKHRTVKLTVYDGEILRSDVDNIITKNHRVRVRARQCGSDRIWTAEEVRRL